MAFRYLFLVDTVTKMRILFVHPDLGKKQKYLYLRLVCKIDYIIDYN